MNKAFKKEKAVPEVKFTTYHNVKITKIVRTGAKSQRLFFDKPLINNGFTGG